MAAPSLSCHITEGINGVLVSLPGRPPGAYMINEPATRYYELMTRSERMPWLVDKGI